MKHKMYLQMFAEAVAGKKIVYLYRILEEAADNEATQIAFVTDNERSKSKDADSTTTKDGTVRTPGATEVEITTTSLVKKADEVVPKLEDAMDNDKLLELWEVNLEEPGEGEDEGKYKAKYFQGYLTEMSLASSSEDNATYDMSFGINGEGVDGYATVTDEQLDTALYVFQDTQPTGASPTKTNLGA
ncbi:MAG: phage major tail protein, TP901-1 family [Bacteroidales bacterium]|nr:phage major tail protein, TP901-1 family [Bacteroidales bacterium]